MSQNFRRFHISSHQPSRWTKSCVFVILRPITSCKTIGLGRKLLIFFLNFFSKVDKSTPAPNFQQWILLWFLVPHWAHLVSVCKFLVPPPALDRVQQAKASALLLTWHFWSMKIFILFLEAPLCLFGILFLYITCHCYVLRAKGVSWNTNSMCHFD